MFYTQSHYLSVFSHLDVFILYEHRTPYDHAYEQNIFKTNITTTDYYYYFLLVII